MTDLKQAYLAALVAPPVEGLGRAGEFVSLRQVRTTAGLNNDNANGAASRLALQGRIEVKDDCKFTSGNGAGKTGKGVRLAA